MGSLCNTPKPPPAPDPTVVANAQGAANIETAREQQRLNLINTSGPYGSVNYAADPNAPGGYSQTTTLSPGQQQILDSGNQAQLGALGIANDQLGRVSSALNRGLDPSGVQQSFNPGGPLQSSFDQGGALQSGYNNGGQIQSSFDQGQGVQGHVAQSPGLQYGFNQGQSVQGDVGPQNLYGAYQTMANASYGQAQSRLDPQFQLQQKQLETGLANQGLSQDSDAWKNAMDTFNRGKNDAYNQANFSSQAAGLNAENTLFGQSATQGQFHNQAAAQQYGQNQGQAQFYNNAANQQFGQNAQAMQLANAAAGQQYGQNLGAMQAGNAAQQQANSQNQQAAGFNNLTAGQQYAQNQGAAAFNNATAGQQYGQNQGAAQFGNQANNQQFQQNAYAQNLPINEFNSLMSSNQIGAPQGINYTPSQVGQTDVLGAYALNTQANNARYQAQMQNQNAMLGGLAQLGGSAMSAAGSAGSFGALFSDIRLKRDVDLIGREDDGLGVWRYRYLWDDEPRIGVMAQEVAQLRPHALVETPSGFLAVDYGRL